MSDVPHITGWNFYGLSAGGSQEPVFVPAEDLPGMTLEAEISLYLQDDWPGKGYPAP